MIEPRPRHPERQHERGGYRAQAFLEIRALLFGDAVAGYLWRKLCKVRRRVHVADHHLGLKPQLQRPQRPPIGGDQPGCQRQGPQNLPLLRLSGAQKGDSEGGMNNLNIHVILMREA